MDFQSVPISGKGRSLTSKTNQKVSRVKKTNSAGTPSTHSHRSKRVLGSSRSTNCMLKREPNKPLSKSSSLGNGKEINQQRQPKYPLKLSSSKHTDKDPVPMEPEVAAEENKLDEIKPKTKKTVSFQEPLVEHLAHIVQEEGSGAFHTPMSSSSSSTEDRVIPGTPYYSAETCGKCRLDRIDSSSYWVAQIRLAESVGKHFLSAAFFRLAAESNAELVPSLRIELRRYLSRHGSLCTDTKWREVSVSYGCESGVPRIAKEQKQTTHEAISRQVLLPSEVAMDCGGN
ncbi:uncharacterized protein LOC122082624 [Macadamia integrifolia]|uniref:uncharacterized protein LOC122082624 n=1 Tax=Macadamia integrifolia TaxID=60698 RepID=UPI001C4E94A8|nr:uncharacterized protein LOC122082624 [Macadamia integrifolia]